VSEKRKFVRFNASFLFRINSGSSSLPAGFVTDISMGGLKVVFDAASGFKVGQIISFCLLLPNQTFELAGQIMWSSQRESKEELGISFIRLPDSYKEDIYNHISKYHRSQLTEKWWQA
jgi:c-di-GMP-binding flagellar brake protein YcgR